MAPAVCAFRNVPELLPPVPARLDDVLVRPVAPPCIVTRVKPALDAVGRVLDGRAYAPARRTANCWMQMSVPQRKTHPAITSADTRRPALSIRRCPGKTCISSSCTRRPAHKLPSKSSTRLTKKQVVICICRVARAPASNRSRSSSGMARTPCCPGQSPPCKGSAACIPECKC